MKADQAWLDDLSALLAPRIAALLDGRACRCTRRDMTMRQMESAILKALPCTYDLVYARAGIPRPWFRAGHALRRLRKAGRVVFRGDELIDVEAQ